MLVAGLSEERGESNVFHAFYQALVKQLFDAGVSRNVYCVNIDTVIAALLLKMLWKPLQAGEIGDRELENAALTIFLYPRMLGCAAEIDDHLNLAATWPHAPRHPSVGSWFEDPHCREPEEVSERRQFG